MMRADAGIMAKKETAMQNDPSLSGSYRQQGRSWLVAILQREEARLQERKKQAQRDGTAELFDQGHWRNVLQYQRSGALVN